MDASALPDAGEDAAARPREAGSPDGDTDARVPGDDASTPDGGSQDAGPNPDAEVPDGSMACVPSDCSDDNVCTTDGCFGGECVHSPVAGPCEDGLFCNGEDFCNDGACTEHGEDPCTGNLTRDVCDEAGDRCVECLDDDHCAPGAHCDTDAGSCTDCNAEQCPACAPSDCAGLGCGAACQAMCVQGQCGCGCP
jgi:hypothetical protein